MLNDYQIFNYRIIAVCSCDKYTRHKAHAAVADDNGIIVRRELSANYRVVSSRD